jgi:hypothetical protein
MFSLRNNTDGMIYIYCLSDPSTGEVRYIGKSIRPMERLMNHMADRSSCHRTHWIQNLLSIGLKPYLGILSWCDSGGDWGSLERECIRLGRESGWRLVNGTDGGDGVPGLNEESRLRIARAWIGRKHSPETLALMSKNRKGRKHKVETRELMSRLRKGRVFTEEHCDRLSVSLRALSDDQVSAIKARIDSGEKVKDLAVEFGVHRTTISKINMGTYFDRYRS